MKARIALALLAASCAVSAQSLTPAAPDPQLEVVTVDINGITYIGSGCNDRTHSVDITPLYGFGTYRANCEDVFIHYPDGVEQGSKVPSLPEGRDLYDYTVRLSKTIYFPHCEFSGSGTYYPNPSRPGVRYNYFAYNCVGASP